MKYFLKRYIPIQKYKQELRIGINDDLVVYPYNKNVLELLEVLIKYGINQEKIRDIELYRFLEDKQMLVPSNPKYRNELFLNYLNVSMNDEKLHSRILILGAGAAGATLTYLLAQFGFQSIYVVDNDTVEESDIEKTMVFKSEHVGYQKIDALQKNIYQNFQSKVVGINKLIESELDLRIIVNDIKPDLVIKAFDPSLVYRRYINNICFEKNIPFVFMAYAFERLNMGPFYVPGKTPCDECFHEHLKDMFQDDDYDYTNFSNFFSEYQTHPSISFNINILCNHIFKDIIFYFSHESKYITTLGKFVQFIPITFQGYTKEVKRRKACHICNESVVV